MAFFLLLALASIPLFLAISLLFYSRAVNTKSFSVFLLLISLWQMGIAVLYSQDVFSITVIDWLFRLFRAGPVFLMPMMYCLGIVMVKQNIELSSYRKLFKFRGFLLLLGFSLAVYVINFTSAGINGYEFVQDGMYSPEHLMPLYGALNITFTINTLLVITNTILFVIVARRIKSRSVRIFHLQISIGAIFIFLNGVLSAFSPLPLYFSSFNSIIIAILLFLSYVRMQSVMLLKANSNLSQQRTLLEKIMDINPNYLAVIDRNDRIIRLNDSICRLLSISKDQMIQQDLSTLLSIRELNPVEDKMLTRTGETLYIKWSYEILELDNRESYTLFIGVDYTEQKQNEQLLLDSEKSKVVGELAASIAHEIRNPLTTVRGLIQLAKEKSEDPKLENIILDEIDRIVEVLKELLLLARPEAKNEREGQSEIINVIEELENIHFLYQSVSIRENKFISIENLLTANGLIDIQKSHFKQIMINFIKNSLEATSPENKIKIKVDSDGKHIRIRIIDNGKGIMKSRLSRIGEPYYTTKEKGTGIGMAVCFKLIKENSGDVKVNSKTGWGTKITVTFPKASALTGEAVEPLFRRDKSI
ncbi:histidine kinase [Jeotgalibacillus alimentarius]|uniref:histidine kinase n=1 Tax=Jeotgalibacillus alimentarius TaxID=135826 RepID=A0A0C2VHE4_9BACL|nr:PAS domain-containing sensor histidine kinase [Jeotgalibacillus alimentarius]KIL43413.1 histidine kinase [Jeotgalibacillus alimentarius]